MTIDRDVELLYEIGTMRHITRSWHQFGGVNFANLAEHTLRVMWIGFVIAKYEGADIGKVLQIALIHDLSETRTGDTNYLSRMYVNTNEEQALQDTIENTILDDEIYDLWQEYKVRETLEAKIVKDADNLDPDFELFERRSVNGSRQREEFEQIRAVVAGRLYTRTAKRIFDALYTSDPESWHLNAPNRHVAGDWQSE